MMQVTPKTTIRTARGMCLPGQKVVLPDAIAKKLIAAGMATATVDMPEKATKPKPKRRKGGAKSADKGSNTTSKRANKSK